MSFLNKKSLIEALEYLGISKGDTVLVHSNIAAFGTMENFSKKEVLSIFYNAFMDILGEQGTLCVPAFFYDYARKKIPFDTELSPVSKELGVFSSYLNTIENRRRSPNPLTSIIAIGKNADYLCEPVNRHSYGEESAYDRLYKLNAKFILLGVDFTSLTFAHYAEHRIGVPYNYTKFFDIPVYSNGILIFDTTFASVRYRECDIVQKGEMPYDSLSYMQKFIDNNVVSSYKYLDGYIYAADANTLFNSFKSRLFECSYSLLAYAPNFEADKYPNK